MMWVTVLWEDRRNYLDGTRMSPVGNHDTGQQGSCSFLCGTETACRMGKLLLQLPLPERKAPWSGSCHHHCRYRTGHASYGLRPITGTSQFLVTRYWELFWWYKRKPNASKVTLVSKTSRKQDLYFTPNSLTMSVTGLIKSHLQSWKVLTFSFPASAVL